jgi:RimJ/RimL family protein N-acetyltransferase
LSIVVRSIQPGDIADVAEIHADGWQHHYRGILPADYLHGVSAARFEEAWRSRIGDDATPIRFLVVTVDDRVAGFAGYGPDAETGRGGEIHGFYTRIEQRSPLAPAILMRAALKALTRQELAPVYLWVFALNTRARRFFEANGFTPDGGTRQETFGGTSVDVVRYRSTGRSQRHDRVPA